MEEVLGDRFLMVLSVPEDKTFPCIHWFYFLSLFFVCVCLLSVALHISHSADSTVAGDRDPTLPLIDPLAEVRREAPDLAAIAEKVRGNPPSFIGQLLVSPVAGEKSTDRSSSDALLSVKRESVFLRCDADDPIVVSDDETREEPTQVSKQVSKGNKNREKGSVSSKDARSGTIRGDGSAEASTESSVADKELNGNEGGVD